MPRYFFDINDGSEIRDHIGRDFNDIKAVRVEVLNVMTNLVAREMDDANETALVLVARDADGAIVIRCRAAYQLEIT